MESKSTFVAIENDGQKRTIENWKKADILLLLEALRVRNQDLYVFMQDCVTKGYRQMNLVGIQCEEPPPLGHYCTSEMKTPTFKSSFNDGQLDILVKMLDDMMVLLIGEICGFKDNKYLRRGLFLLKVFFTMLA